MEPLNQLPCSNCNKLFPEDRIHLHQSYCVRNIRRCDQCQMFIDVHQLDSHKQKCQSKAPCPYCKQDFVSDKLSKHYGICQLRPKPCTYCKYSHETECGKRTKICQICQRNIMLKEHIIHEIRCREQHNPISPPPLPPNINRETTNNRHNQRRNVLQNRSRDQQITRNTDNIQLNRGQRSLSNKNKQTRQKNNVKFHKIIPYQLVKPVINILPISVQITINNLKKQIQNTSPAKEL